MRLGVALLGTLAMTACSLLVDTSSLSGATAIVDAGGGDVVPSDGGDAADGASTPDSAQDAADGYAAVVLADKPVLYWQLRESAGTLVVNDSSGHNRTGRVLGSPTFGVAGVGGGGDTAVKFTGSSSLILDTPIEFVGTAAYTLEAWTAPDTVDTTYRFLLAAENTTPQRHGYNLIFHATAGVGSERYVAGVEGSSYSRPPPSLHVYHHIVATYDGQVLTLIVDGVVVKTNADQRSQTTIGNPMTIATNFLGTVDEIAIYDYAITPLGGRTDFRRHALNARTTGTLVISALARTRAVGVRIQRSRASTCTRFRWARHHACSPRMARPKHLRAAEPAHEQPGQSATAHRARHERRGTRPARDPAGHPQPRGSRMFSS